jgi:hypothetical protein
MVAGLSLVREASVFESSWQLHVAGVFEHKLTEPGVIMAALGMETHNGDFEVIDVCFAGLPEIYQPEAGPSNVEEPETKGKGKAKAKAETQANGSEMDEGESD